MSVHMSLGWFLGLGGAWGKCVLGSLLPEGRWGVPRFGLVLSVSVRAVLDA